MHSSGSDASDLQSNNINPANQRISIIILCCFFLSGFLGLVYEIIWIRKLGLLLGTTVFAMSTVMAAFFGGLALGSLVFGRIANRVGNPVKVYAYLEFAVGAFALLFPTLLYLFSQFYTIFYPYIYRSFIILTLSRFILLVLILAIPTTMMGGTLPLLSQYFVKRHSNMSFKVGILYALNTFGATLGAFLCGFYFIRYLGVDTTNYIAGILNLLVGLVAYLSASKLHQMRDEERTERKAELSMSEPSPETRFLRENGFLPGAFMVKIILICYFFAGFTALAYEIVWTRYLSLALENTVYTYTIILTVFLLGIALGSILFARLFDKVKDLLRLFGYLELGIGLSAFVLGPIVYLFFLKVAYRMLIFELLVCGVLMLIPTTLMGATFPLIVKMLTSNAHRIGYSTGRLYAINTSGCIAGSLSAGFLLLPVLGINLSLSILVAINILIGFLCLFANPKRSLKFNAIAVVLILGALIGSHLALKIQVPHEVLSIVKTPEEKIILLEEGLENTVWVTVNQENRQKSIWANKTVLGRTKAEGQFNIAPQPIQGHIPMLIHPDEPKKILGICLGTGQTFGSILMYDIEKMDVVDISKTLVDAALEHFADYNGDIGNDARTTIIVEDGRNFVTHTQNMYDIITLEPSPPEEAGIVNLYTREFYQLCQKRLNQDGIMSQWLPLYNTRPNETVRIIKTFISVFENALLWYNNADLLLLGFNDEIHLDVPKISARLKNEKVYDALNLSYLGYPEYNLNQIDNFLAGFLIGPEELRSISHSVPAYTDNHPDLEFSASHIRFANPQETTATKVKATNDFVLQCSSLDNNILKDNLQLQWNSQDRPEWLKIQNTDLLSSHLTSLNSYLPTIPTEELKRVEKVRAQYIAHLYAQAYDALGIARSRENNFEDAIAFYQQAVEYNPHYAPAYGNLGKDYYINGQHSAAIEAYKTAVKLAPNLSEGWHGLGSVYFAIGWLDDAIASWRRAIEIKPDFSEVYNNLGVAYAAKGRYYTAIDFYQKAIKFKPDYADAYYNLGLVYEVTNQLQSAYAAYEKAIEINPNFTDARKKLKERIKK